MFIFYLLIQNNLQADVNPSSVIRYPSSLIRIPDLYTALAQSVQWMLDDHVLLPSAYNSGASMMGVASGAGAADGSEQDGSVGVVQVRWDPLAHPSIVEWLSEQQCQGGKQIDTEWLWTSKRGEAVRGSRFISIPCQVGQGRVRRRLVGSGVGLCSAVPELDPPRHARRARTHAYTHVRTHVYIHTHSSFSTSG